MSIEKDKDLEKIFDELRLDQLSKNFETKFIKQHRLSLLKKRVLISVVIIGGIGLSWLVLNRVGHKKEDTNSVINPDLNQSKTVQSDTHVVENHSDTKPVLPEDKGIETELIHVNTFDNQLDKTKLVLDVPMVIKSKVEEKSSNNTNKNNVVNDEKSICEGVLISFSTKVTPTCFGQSDGEIEVITSRNYKKFLNGNESNLESLSAGIYQLQLSDENNCKSKIESIKIHEKHCIDPESLVYSISNKNDIVMPTKSGIKFSMYDKYGTEVFSKTSDSEMIKISESDYSSYSLKEGLYFLIIQNGDIKEKLELTVVY